MFDVTCLGILVADAVVKSVDKMPESGKLQPVNQLTLHTGGCAANAAVDLAKIGVKTAIIGKIGKDGFGQFMYKAMSDSGVNIEGLATKEGINTSSSVVLVSSTGERSFLHCIGSNADLVFEDINFEIIRNSKILFIAGTNLMPGLDGEPCSRILKKAQEMGVFTALDTAWDATGRWMEIVEPSLQYLDLFIPSFDEARLIAKKDEPEEIADVFLDKGVKLAVIKLGKDGCFIKSKEGLKYTVPTYLDIKPVDTNGAGDSFAAGFIAGLLQKWDLEKCGRFANAVGTHCIMEVGASTGIKTMEEILAFMRKYEKN